MDSSIHRRVRSAAWSLRAAVYLCWGVGGVVLVAASVMGWLGIQDGRSLQLFFFLRTLPLALVLFILGGYIQATMLTPLLRVRRILPRATRTTVLMRFTHIHTAEGYVMEFKAVDKPGMVMSRAVLRADVKWPGLRPWERKADIWMEDPTMQGRVLAHDGRMLYFGRFLTPGETVRAGSKLLLALLLLFLFVGLLLTLDYWYGFMGGV